MLENTTLETTNNMQNDSFEEYDDFDFNQDDFGEVTEEFKQAQEQFTSILKSDQPTAVKLEQIKYIQTQPLQQSQPQVQTQPVQLQPQPMQRSQPQVQSQPVQQTGVVNQPDSSQSIEQLKNHYEGIIYKLKSELEGYDAKFKTLESRLRNEEDLRKTIIQQQDTINTLKEKSAEYKRYYEIHEHPSKYHTISQKEVGVDKPITELQYNDMLVFKKQALDREKEIKQLEEKIHLLEIRNDQTKMQLEHSDLRKASSAKRKNYLNRSHTILYKTIYENKKPQEIADETGLSIRTIFNVLSVSKEDDKERLFSLTYEFDDLKKTDVAAFYSSRFIKLHNRKKPA